MSAEHSSRRWIEIYVTPDGIEIKLDHGIVLAEGDQDADFEIEIKGVPGNHVVRLDLDRPRIRA